MSQELKNDFISVNIKEIDPWHDERLRAETQRFLERCQQIALQKPSDVQILTLADFWPVSVNELMYANKYERHKLKKQDAEIIAYEAYEQKIRKATGKRLVKVTLFYGARGNRKNGRRGDEDNLCKSIYDSLVQAGLIKDDSSRWCIKEMPQFVEGNIPGTKKRGCIIVLEDLPGAENERSEHDSSE